MLDSFLRCNIILINLKKNYLFIHKRHGEREAETQAEGEAPCREPDVELHPRTPGSCRELKADAQPLSHPGVPILIN